MGQRFSRIETQQLSVFVARFELWTPVSVCIQKAVDCLKPAGWEREDIQGQLLLLILNIQASGKSVQVKG